MNSNLFRDRPVAVIGAGVMGVGIVQVALLAGHPVWLHDAREGWISLTRARDTYGVVLTGSREMDDLALDEAATATERAKLRAGRASAA